MAHDHHAHDDTPIAIQAFRRAEPAVWFCLVIAFVLTASALIWYEAAAERAWAAKHHRAAAAHGDTAHGRAAAAPGH